MGSSELEICSNCGREISRSEQAYVLNDKIVCAECNGKLRSKNQNGQKEFGQESKTSSLAIASLVLGIAAFITFITGIGGVALGVVALKQIKKAKGELQGRGMAIAGIITGAIPCFLLPIPAIWWVVDSGWLMWKDVLVMSLAVSVLITTAGVLLIPPMVKMKRIEVFMAGLLLGLFPETLRRIGFVHPYKPGEAPSMIYTFAIIHWAMGVMWACMIAGIVAKVRKRNTQSDTKQMNFNGFCARNQDTKEQQKKACLSSQSP